MQGFFFVKFGLVLIYTLKIDRKNPLRFYEEKICSIHYFHFSFEKHVPSQVMKDFYDENVETSPRSICLELLIIGIVFYHYT